jgi:multisubunit Na+/H+ antiporter MnhF subunit
MSILISLTILLSLIPISFRFFIAQNSYEKILCFYLLASNLILLILVNAVPEFNAILDIILILFLLKLLAVLFLLFNRKKI